MKMKKLVSLGMAMILSLGLVACNGGEDKNSTSSSTEKLEQIQESGKLVVGIYPDYPPFEFHSTKSGKNEIAGVDKDLGEAIAKEIGVEAEFKEITFDGLIGALKADKIDIVLSGMSPTPEREKSVDFSDLYYVGKNILAVKEGEENKIKTIDELKDLKVAVQKGSIQEAYITKLGCKSIKSLESIPDVMTELKNGNVDAVVVNDTVGILNIQEMGGLAKANLELPNDNADEGMAAAIKKGDNKAYLEKINKTVKEFKANQFEKSLKENTDLATQNK
ncbi:transporter substrate-binding domain-containing protein [Peptacetobacter sp.]|uniref:transporter substrate-binding domain-containing protein n=1 Tax=Peptacetobacter sp. TaxID=2991975 RepID=UPI0026397C71|nr:transporter substrate-binding domain-containing protein [Peptacetobacter sp.]